VLRAEDGGLPGDGGEPISLQDSEINSYINANLIGNGGRVDCARYIATQSPLASTMVDFWRMIWQEGVAIVVAITAPNEPVYWPTVAATTQLYGRVSVTCTTHSKCPTFVVTELTLQYQNSDEVRTVRHFAFTSWPATSVPVTADCRANPSPLLAMISAVRETTLLGGPDHPPTVVHCDTGVGRTGAYIVIDRALSQFERSHHIDLVDIVRYIRKFRMSMVDRLALYKFAWQAVVSALQLRIEEFGGGRIYAMGSTLSCEMSAVLRRDSLSSMSSYDMARVGDDTAFALRGDTKAIEIVKSDTALLHTKSKRPRDMFSEADIGKRVIVSGIDCFGTLRFIGTHPVHQTPRVGVELDAQLGNMDGAQDGHRFFECPEGHGILCILAKVTRVHGSVARQKRPQLTVKEVGCTVFVNGKGLGTFVFYRPPDKSAGVEEILGVTFAKPIGNTDGTLDDVRLFECEPNFGMFLNRKVVRRVTVTADDVGRLVTVRGYDSVGILRFYGDHENKSYGTWCGVELDHPIGKNDGTVNNVEYFTCKQVRRTSGCSHPSSLPTVTLFLSALCTFLRLDFPLSGYLCTLSGFPLSDFALPCVLRCTSQDHGVLCVPAKVRLHYANLKPRPVDAPRPLPAENT
jgi:protein tyrosine phosphatase